MKPTREFLEDIQARAEVQVSPDDVQGVIRRLADALNEDFKGQQPLLLCLLNGGLYLTGQLLPLLTFPLRLTYMHASRYGHAQQGQALNWVAKIPERIEGETVIIIDDILDEGHTLAEIQGHCRQAGAKAVYTVVGVEKQHGRKVPGVQADYIGVQVADRFLFGFGMDYQGYFRNLPGVYALPRELERGD